MKLEKCSWIAGIVAAVVGVLAWLVNRNDFIAFCESSGKIIVTPFSIAWNCLTYPVTWPIWALILLAFSGLAVVAGLFYFFGKAGDKEAQTVRLNPLDYVADEIFGVHWTWSYIYGKLDANNLTAFCPRQGCMRRLEHKLNSNPPHSNRFNQFADDFPVSLFCPKCGFQKDMEWNWQNLARNVLVEVEGRIRTGEFKNN